VQHRPVGILIHKSPLSLRVIPLPPYNSALRSAATVPGKVSKYEASIRVISGVVILLICSIFHGLALIRTPTGCVMPPSVFVQFGQRKPVLNYLIFVVHVGTPLSTPDEAGQTVSLHPCANSNDAPLESLARIWIL
jgi:hypothetical protein